MAKYIYVEKHRFFTYALDECEDYVIIDAYLRIKESGNFNTTIGMNKFERYHLADGATLNDTILLKFNDFMRVLGYKPVLFVNGHSTSYSMLRGHDKIVRREAMIERLRGMTPAERDDFIDRKRAEAAALPERATESAQPVSDEKMLRREEIERRRAAVAASQRADAVIPATRPGPKATVVEEPRQEQPAPASVADLEPVDDVVAASVAIKLHPAGKKALRLAAVAADRPLSDLLAEVVEVWARQHGITEPVRIAGRH
ncbi:MAG TPA: hypothetical protein VN809_14990 [Telmatospirillum sp.]|nr:hypothetical protein [Telmatospirillum sp.]